MARKREEKGSSRKSSPLTSSSSSTSLSENKSKGGKSKYREDQDDSIDLLRAQLQKLGLGIREVPGDGNCLFRAIGDQLDGHMRNHLRYRQDAVQYMLEHKEDFQPFVEDDVPFDKHTSMLSQAGTYAGNDAIVALARLLGLTIVIHQANAPLWRVHGWDAHSSGPNQSHSPAASLAPSQRKELHIAYHGGDHYDSVRRLGDTSQGPANIRLASNPEPLCSPKRPAANEGEETDLERQAMLQSGCHDLRRVREALETNHFILEAAVEDLIEETVLTSSFPQKDDGIWSDSGSGTRIFGNTAALDNSTSRSLRSKNLSAKRVRELKKQERKKASEERKRGGSNSSGSLDHNSDSDSVSPGGVIRQVQCLNI